MRRFRLPLELLPALAALAVGGGPTAEHPAPAAPPAATTKQLLVPRVPLVFFENRGQLADEVFFETRVPGLSLLVFRDGWSLALPQERTSLRVRFERASSAAKVEGLDLQQASANYWIGSQDPIRAVKGFGRVRIHALYPGVDLELLDNAGELEYDLRLAPAHGVEDLVFRVEGAEACRIDSDGSLVMRVGGRELLQRVPQSYEIEEDGTRRALPSAFRPAGDGCFGFVIEGRRPDRPLVIDPVLVSSELIGGSNADEAHAVAVDAQGAVYVAGWALSNDFPGRERDEDGQGRRGEKDAVVFKLDKNGSELQWVTFLGGEGNDEGHAVAVNTAGEVFVAGETESEDLPTTRDAYSRAFGGDVDAFVVRLSADGSSVHWATYLGGSAADRALGLALGSDDSPFVVGSTQSADFPASPGSFQEERPGGRDAFVTKLDGQGTVLVYSTYLGGVRDDEGRAIAVDENSHAYVAGRTDSADFPLTSAAHDLRKNDADGFVTKLGLGGHPLFSTFLGGSREEEIRAIAVGAEREAWVGGWTQSSDFPVTLDAYQSASRSQRDGFLTRLTESGGSLSWSTYLAGAGEDEVLGLALDGLGTLWVVGRTSSEDFPHTPDASQVRRGGADDAFLVAFDPGLADPAFGTYLGGRGDERALAVAVQPATEKVVLVGAADELDPRDSDSAGGKRPTDALVARFEPGVCGTRAELSVLGPSCGASLRTSLPRLGRPFRLDVRDAPALARGYVLVSTAGPSSVMIQGICESHLDPTTTKILFSFTTDAMGSWSLATRFPRDPAWCARSFALQVVILAKNEGPLSFGALTEGLLLSVGD